METAPLVHTTAAGVKRRMTAKEVVVTLIAGVSLMFLGGAAMAQDSAGSKGNIVLVHGAWANGSSWDGVIQRLQAEGYNVIAPNFALGALAGDVAQLRRILSIQDGPTLVVGHSYGGVIISALSGDAPNVAGLVFVASFGLDEGESINGLLGDGPPPPGLAHLHVDAYGYVWMPEADFLGHFAPDVEPVLARAMYAAQQPGLGEGFGMPMVTPSWRSHPTWYVIASNDAVLPAPAQHFFAQRMGATVLELEASHVVMVSRPDEVAAFIVSAAKIALGSD